MSEVKTLKLSTGVDIVATVVETGDVYTLKDAIVLHQVDAGDGQLQIAVLPFLAYSAKTESFEINSKHIIVVSVPSIEILNQYNSVFETIVTPKKQSIIV